MKGKFEWWVSVTHGAKGAAGGVLDGHVDMIGFASYREARALVDWALLSMDRVSDVLSAVELADFDGRMVWSSHTDGSWRDLLPMPLKVGAYEWDERSQSFDCYSSEPCLVIEAHMVKGVQGASPGRAREAAEA